MSEINTDNLVRNLLTSGSKGYPVTADMRNKDGVVWYEQNSYKGGTCKNPILKKLFDTASKSGKGHAGRAEFVIDTPEFYIVIEDKDDTKTTMFSGYSDISKYIEKGYDKFRLYKCPIDDVLWYADHLKSEKDVIAIANFSDGTPENFQSATFYVPKNCDMKDIKILCHDGYASALLSLSDYKSKIAVLSGEKERTYEQVYDTLRKYADTCSRFFYKVGVADADRLGLVSIVALALTNKKSDLYEKVTKGTQSINKDDIETALLEASDTTKYGIITDPKKGLPTEKVATLREYVQKILIDSSLTNKCDALTSWDENDKSEEQFFANGSDSILSRTVYSIYNNVILTYDKYKDTGIDIMGTFYSLFLIYYASDKKKGIVLTPNHVTRLFCDIAEYFRGEKIDKNTTILDICTGSGGFLIAALHYIDKSIDEDDSLNAKQKKIAKENARKRCLIGTEVAPSMFMLAYANMNFHGDGSSRLYNLDCLSSYIEDRQTFGAELCKLYDPDEKLREKIYSELSDAIEQHEKESDEEYKQRISNLATDRIFEENGADICMINPPYGKDFEEYDFIKAELKYLKKGGIGLAIVPVSNQGISKNALKIDVLQKHTLLASILMPNQLFANIRNSGASVGTCILVFKAHIPHQEFLNNEGKTFLADWREDGFKMVNKHGRFEYKNGWYEPVKGYHDMYMSDMDKTIGKDTFEKQTLLLNTYNKAFPDDVVTQATAIPSSAFNKDIHLGGIKSIAIKVFDNPHTITRQKEDNDGNPKWKEKKVKGQQEFVLDDDGNKIPVMETVKIWDNMDWSILDYVKTDYHELTNKNFIKTMKNYKLFEYMYSNKMLYTNSSEEGEE